MGMLAKHICGKQGCRVLTSSRFCGDHSNQVIVQSRQFDKQRAEDPIRQLYFTQQWRAARDQIVGRKGGQDGRDPICKLCGIAESTDADHKTAAKEYMRSFDPSSDEGQRRFCDLDNLQGLCKSCHSSKTAKETNSFRSQ